MSADPLPEEPQYDRGAPNAIGASSKLRSALLVFVIAALPLILLLIFLNVRKANQESLEKDQTTPAQRIDAPPETSSDPAAIR
ncbi:hypothetical protein FYK55_07735 [Roseiconus nitratireducens]|uniref:Uncharacterized protein n=1 Tax=Roseiconus nitratireducens TaxID=2605748 RepID=A0A5M6DDC2_9BACT|nr:hypothetical protein [Roseiconus nitratireducens]KAA5545524.1 hypothetical protein FYK55_07735 [Roseiconus nitratireducens]